MLLKAHQRKVIVHTAILIAAGCAPAAALDPSGKTQQEGVAHSQQPACGEPAPEPAPPPAPTPPPQAGSPTLAGCPSFPADNAWNQRVIDLPVDPRSDQYMAAMNAGSRSLHPDFGGDGEYGIPWTTVSGSQPRVPVSFDYSSESDPGPYPIPPDAPVEIGAGDRHILVVDRDNCMLYETFDSHFVGPGWHVGSGAIFDLRSNAVRPHGWTSADAAGLPILPGLARVDEVKAGRINHALRFTVQRTQRAFVWPARHQAGASTDPSLPPMGLRVRLKASYDISGFAPSAQVILTALKEYGMFLADNGGDWFISGEENPSWIDDELVQLKRVPASAFEVVQHGALEY
jgi:hypothetical protein